MRRFLFKRFWRRSRRISGFSLVEVLVTTILTTLLVSSLLYVMVDLTSANQTEQASSNTNEEMKQTLNHIATELREATYVYTGEELSESRIQGIKTLLPLKNYLPNFGTNTRPILAFWKVEPVPYDGVGNLPSSCTNSNTTIQNECEVLLTERRTYTLVVYVQSTDNPNNEWKGESRIWRYQLRKYSDLSPVTKTTGYVDPTLDSSFQDWPYNFNGDLVLTPLPQTDPSNYVPLVDFVASPTTTVGSINCPITKNPPLTGSLEYKTSPFGTVPTGDSTFYQANYAKSFYACVRDASSDTDTGFNQDVVIFLRGNSKGKPGVEKDNMLEILQTQVISRGVVRKTVGD